MPMATRVFTTAMCKLCLCIPWADAHKHRAKNPQLFWFPQAEGMGCAAVSHYYQAQGVSMATPCLDFTAAFSNTFTLSVCLSVCLSFTHTNQTSLLSSLSTPLSIQITPLLFLPHTAKNSAWLSLGTQQKRGKDPDPNCPQMAATPKQSPDPPASFTAKLDLDTFTGDLSGSLWWHRTKSRQPPELLPKIWRIGLPRGNK